MLYTHLPSELRVSAPVRLQFTVVDVKSAIRNFHGLRGPDFRIVGDTPKNIKSEICCLVGRGLINMIDDQDLDSCFVRLKSQPELRFQGAENRSSRVFVRRLKTIKDEAVCTLTSRW